MNSVESILQRCINILLVALCRLTIRFAQIQVVNKYINIPTRLPVLNIEPTRRCACETAFFVHRVAHNA
jgi:hypothetical protein